MQGDTPLGEIIWSCCCVSDMALLLFICIFNICPCLYYILDDLYMCGTARSLVIVSSVLSSQEKWRFQSPVACRLHTQNVKCGMCTSIYPRNMDKNTEYTMQQPLIFPNKWYHLVMTNRAMERSTIFKNDKVHHF
jgi:hypothetical protein